MNILLIGTNHKTAPISIREQFYLNKLQQNLLLSELKCQLLIAEAFVLSTCNRTEICINMIDKGVKPEFLVQLICKIKEIDFDPECMQYFYEHRRKEALEHLLRVVCGLDSLVIGEKQILGQVKNAFEVASEKQFFQKTFNVMANTILRTGKKAQTETDIGHGGSSVSWAAMRQAEHVLGPLKERAVLFIGAGKMSKLAVGQIFNKGYKRLLLMNRSMENAEKLAAQYGGEVVSFCDIKETLSEVDLVICSVSAPHYILEKDTVRKALHSRYGRKLVIIDISMPRNIDPDVAEVEGVTLYHIDDLQSVVDESLAKRTQAIDKVEKIIYSKLDEFYVKMSKVDTQNPSYYFRNR